MTRLPLIAGCVAAAALGAVVVLAVSAGGSTGSPPDRADAVVTALGLPSAPAVDVVTAALPTTRPARGAVAPVTGPFDDRFSFTGLALGSRGVTGGLTVTSDVSEIIDLQVLVGFYDASGSFLGSRAYEKHGESAADVDERVLFDIAPDPSYATEVASAAIGVPVLVNE